MKLVMLTLVSAALAAPATGTLAVEDHDHEHGGHGAHVHGLGRLDLAQEGAEVHLRLDTPAANLVGFEHAPRSDAERVALDEAVTALKDGAALFRFPEAAGCILAEASVQSSLLGVEEVTGLDAPDQERAQDGDPGAHADMEAEYRFLCTQPALLKEVRVKLFERFPDFERLLVQLVTDRGQAGAELTPGSPLLGL